MRDMNGEYLCMACTYTANDVHICASYVFACVFYFWGVMLVGLFDGVHNRLLFLFVHAFLDDGSKNRYSSRNMSRWWN